jgi:hypothetical protein
MGMINVEKFTQNFIPQQESEQIPLQAWRGPEVSGRLRLPDFNRHMKVVR